MFDKDKRKPSGEPSQVFVAAGHQLRMVMIGARCNTAKAKCDEAPEILAASRALLPLLDTKSVMAVEPLKICGSQDLKRGLVDTWR